MITGFMPTVNSTDWENGAPIDWRPHHCLTVMSYCLEFRPYIDEPEKINLDKLGFVAITDLNGTTPAMVWDSLTDFYRRILKVVKSVNDATTPDELKIQYTNPDYDPIEEWLSEKAMQLAMGNFIMKWAIDINGVEDEQKAHDLAILKYPSLKEYMRAFLTDNTLRAVYHISKAAKEANLKPEKGELDAIGIAVKGYDDKYGFRIQFTYDGKTLMLLRDKPVEDGLVKSDDMYV